MSKKCYSREEALEQIEYFTKDYEGSPLPMPQIVGSILNDLATCIKYEQETGVFLWHEMINNKDFVLEQLKEHKVIFVVPNEIAIMTDAFYEDNSFSNAPIELVRLFDSLYYCVFGEAMGLDFWGTEPDEVFDYLFRRSEKNFEKGKLKSTLEKLCAASAKYAINSKV